MIKDEERDMNGVGRNYKDVGVYPFPRGDTPVFHFDQGDEVS